MPTQYTPNSIATSEGFMYQQPDGPFGANSYSIKSAGYSRILFNQAPKLNPEEDFTVECWYRFDEADFNGNSGNAYPVIIYDTSNTFTIAGVIAGSTTTKIQCIVNDYSSTDNTSVTRTITSSADVLSVNTWHHIVVARSNNTITIYVDGAEAASLTTLSPVMLHRSITFSFGRRDIVGRSAISSYANIRISRSCKYSQPFSRPTGPFEYTSDAIVMYQAPYIEAERHIITIMSDFSGQQESVGDISITSSQWTGIAMDSNRNIYIADAQNHVIRKIDTNNYVSIFAGIAGTTGVLNGSVATACTFNTPVAIAVDSANNLYVSDQGNRRIRKITQAGVVTTFSGSGASGNTNGSAGVTTYTSIESIVVDSSGNVYVADNGGYRVRKITAAGVSTTLAGSTIGYTDSSTNTLVKFNNIARMAIYNSNLFVTDYGNSSVRRISLTNGATTTFDFVSLATGICVNSTYGVMFVGANKKILMYDLFNNDADFTTSSFIATSPTTITGQQDGPLYSAEINTVTDMCVDSNNTDTIYIANNNAGSFVRGLRKTYKNNQPINTQGSTELILTGDGLHGDSNNIIINKGESISSARYQYTASVTSGSGPFGSMVTSYLAFSGATGEYLNYPASTATDLTTGDFTIELWYQTFNAGVMGRRILTFGSTNNTNSLQLIQGNSASNGNFISLFGGTGSTYWVNNTTRNINDGAWHHIAITRSGDSLRLYIDGTQIGSTYNLAVNLSNSATQGMWVAATTTSMASTPCNIASLRVIKGTALYTGTTLTIPTTPSSWVSGTTILIFSDYLTDKTLTKTDTQIVNDTPYTNGSETTSLYLSGATSVVATDVADNSFNFASEAFTIEGWFKLSDTNTSDNIGLVSCMNNETASTLRGWVVNYDNSNKILEFKSFVRGAVAVSVSGNTINLANNTWFHVALSQQGDSNTSHRARMFINGALYATSSTAVTLPGNSPYRLTIGEWDMDITGRRKMIGNISSVRIVRNSSLYSSTFTPSTTIPQNVFNSQSIVTSFLYRAPYDTSYVYSMWGPNLDINKTSICQGSINPYSSTANCGSLYVDSNSEPVIGPSDPFQLGTGNFTIEFWIKPMLQSSSSNDRSYTILGQPSGIASGAAALWYIAMGRDPIFGVLQGITFATTNNASYTAALRTANYLTAGQWHHIVFQRSGTTWSAYINGRSVTLTAGSDYSAWSNSVNLNIDPSTIVYAGLPSPAAPYYLSDVRIVKGSVLYSGATITVPTTPHTLDANRRTALLLNFTDSKVKDLSNNHNILTKNGASISDAQFRSGTGSLYFDGVNDFIFVPSLKEFNFGLSNFTIEFWIHPLAYGSGGAGGQIFGTNSPTSSTRGYSINIGQDINSFRIISDAVDYNAIAKQGTWGDTLTVSANGGPALNEWTHMAIVRDGTNLTIYKNGISVATTSSALYWFFGGTDAYIGLYSQGAQTQYFNGYIDNLRVTRDRAVYTSGFVPPVRVYSTF